VGVSVVRARAGAGDPWGPPPSPCAAHGGVSLLYRGGFCSSLWLSSSRGSIPAPGRTPTRPHAPPRCGPGRPTARRGRGVERRHDRCGTTAWPAHGLGTADPRRHGRAEWEGRGGGGDERFVFPATLAHNTPSSHSSPAHRISAFVPTGRPRPSRQGEQRAGPRRRACATRARALVRVCAKTIATTGGLPSPATRACPPRAAPSPARPGATARPGRAPALPRRSRCAAARRGVRGLVAPDSQAREVLPNIVARREHLARSAPCCRPPAARRAPRDGGPARSTRPLPTRAAGRSGGRSSLSPSPLSPLSPSPPTHTRLTCAATNHPVSSHPARQRR
jgi:hypothetical protein